MYFLVILGLIAVCILVEGAGMRFSVGWGAMLADFPSLLLLLLIVIPVLLASNLLKDFGNAFRLFLGKKGREGVAEKKKAVEALDVVMKALRDGGIFAVLLQFVSLCGVLKGFDAMRWQSNMVPLLMPLLYAYMLNLLFLPIRSRLNREIIDYMKNAEDEEDEGEE